MVKFSGKYSIHSAHMGLLDGPRFRYTTRSWSMPLIDNFTVSWTKRRRRYFYPTVIIKNEGAKKRSHHVEGIFL